MPASPRMQDAVRFAYVQTFMAKNIVGRNHVEVKIGDEEVIDI